MPPPSQAVALPWAAFRTPLLLLVALVGLVVLFAFAMARPVFYDEDQFLAAGLLVSRGLLPYRDFVLLQPPLLPLLLGGVFKLTGGWYVLTARLLTFVLAVGSGAALWAVLRRLGADRLLAAVLLAACLASPFLLTPLASVRNEALPLFLFLLGFLLHHRAGDGSWLERFAAALLMGLAAEARLAYVFAPLAILVHAAVSPRHRLLPVLSGLVLAALPGALMVAASGWDRVRFGLLDFQNEAVPAWYRAQGLEAELAVPDRLQTVLAWLFVDGNLTLTVLSVTLMLLTIARRRNWKRPGQLLVLMLFAAAVLAFVPAPAWAMSFAPLAPLLACCVAHLDRITTFLADPFKKRVLVLVAALPVVPALLNTGPEVLRAMRGDWAGLAAHRSALAVRAAMPPGGGAVATLFPHLVMDANPILPALSAGPLIFRSGATFPPGRLAGVGAISSAVLIDAFAAAPPAGIFAGAFGTVFRAPMDAPLTDWAGEQGWRLVETDRGGGRLWIP